MAILILNAGSSSLKFSLLDRTGEDLLAQGTIDVPPGGGSWNESPDAMRRVAADVAGSSQRERLTAVAHRVVNGGAAFTDPVRITAEVRSALAPLVDLAPLHNKPSLDVIDAALRQFPDVPHVAVFDTAFHRTLLPSAYTYPIPSAWTGRWGLRRFGFHGLSYSWAAERAALMLGTPSPRLVIAHLGSGASMAAVSDGRSVDTTMGFTPLEGLMMGTRSGSIDPGVMLHLQLHGGLSAEQLAEGLNHESGLLGVSGLSGDMRKIVDAVRRGDPRARLAFDMFVHRARQAVGAMAVTLGAVDGLVFTGGIGEHSPDVRAAICNGLECLGLTLDPDANARASTDAIISSAGSRGSVLVVQAREDLVMARAAAACLAQSTDADISA